MKSANGRAFKILSINLSEEKGVQKVPVESALLQVQHGLVGDAHAGPWHRQVSLLANEDIELMRNAGADVTYGSFAENITTDGIPLAKLPIGTVLEIGDAILEITQIGKECHQRCAIFHMVGDCVMPRCGVFARVLHGGEICCDSECYYHL